MGVNLIFKLHKKINQTSNKYFRIFLLYIYLFLIKINNCSIGKDTQFADVPIFPHQLYGIFISNGAKIGKNVVIFHQVTIGSNTISDSKNYGAPTIGDNVYIGAGAKIIGNVVIGNNVRIGANAVVVKDVEDDCVVVNQPCRIIKKDKNLNKFETF